MVSRTIRGQLRVLVAAVCVLMLLGCGVVLFALRAQSENVERLTTVIGPARDANTAVLAAMTDADQALADFVIEPRQAPIAKLADARLRMVTAQSAVRGLLRDRHLSADDRRTYSSLEARRDGALAAWTHYADRELSRVRSGLPADTVTGDALVARFRSAHAALTGKLTMARDELRAARRDIVPQITLVVLAVTGLLLLGIVLIALRTSRSLTDPIAQLRWVVQRVRAGETVRADERLGAGEVRELAGAFNALVAHNAELVAEQVEVLRLHQVALEADRAIREAATAAEAIDLVCELVGPAVDADRLVVCLVDGDGLVTRSAQWHAANLPDFPPDVSPYAGSVAERLWRQSTYLAVADVDAMAAEHDCWVGTFRREAGARSLLVVPVGLSDSALGTISVANGRGPRTWRTAEVAMLHHVAAALAHLIAAVSHRERQAEHVAVLERLDRQKDDFLSTVSHELRTPLASIVGYLELLEDEDVGPDQRAMLNVVERNTVRLRGLVEDLLVMNRMAAGEGVGGDHSVSVPALVARTVEELRPLADKGDVRLELAAASAVALVRGDRANLQRAVVNIVANAIKFTPRRGVVRVSHGVDPASGEVVITCADTGIGIPRADLELLTDRFFRARNVANDAIPGTGLGLAIVKAIADAHRGHLVIDSTEGRGTTVSLRLPNASGAVLSTVHTR